MLRLNSLFGVWTGLLLFIGWSNFASSNHCFVMAYQDETTQDDGDEFKVTAAALNFLEQMKTGDFEGATSTFDKTMSQAMPSKTLEATWKQVLGQAGELKTSAKPTVSRAGVYVIVTIPCQFEKKALDTIVTFNSESEIAGLFFRPGWTAPKYVDESKFTESEVTIGVDPWKLPGLIALPKEAAVQKVPAVVLVHGSGPQDRDETVGPNKPFRDIAQGLATRGIAVIRYDKRTLVHGGQLVELGNTTVFEESVEDALLAVKQLRDHPNIDQEKIFVLGHSLGGYLMPRIVESDKEGHITGVILLAGNTRSLPDLLDAQIPYLLSLDGKISDEDQKQIDQQKAVSEQIRDLDYLKSMKAGQMLMGAPKEYYIDLHEYAPAKQAATMFSRALLLQGERDYQVTMQGDFAIWKSALEFKDGISFKSYPKLNHLFIAGRGKSKPVEYQRPGNVAAEVINDIANWIGE